MFVCDLVRQLREARKGLREEQANEWECELRRIKQDSKGQEKKSRALIPYGDSATEREAGLLPSRLWVGWRKTRTHVWRQRVQTEENGLWWRGGGGGSGG